MKEIWKQFEEAELTHSSAHHLMAICALVQKDGYARATDIANYLDITRGSVSVTLHNLKQKGYLTEDKNKHLKLTDRGNKVVNYVLRNRSVIKSFFKDALDLSDEQAEIDACKVENLISKQVGEKLIAFMEYFLSNQTVAVNFRKGSKDFNPIKDNE